MIDPGIFAQFGFPALLVAVLLYMHRGERKEWLEVTKAIFDRADQRQAETNECIREMSSTVQSLNDRTIKRPEATLAKIKG